jgi:hypothetical protein
MGTFSLQKEKMFHFPHNSALREEFDFMLQILNPEKTEQRVYTITEICEKMLIEQNKAKVFKNFHSKPYAIFTRFPPPDMPTLQKKMGKRRAKMLANKRIRAYRNFISSPEKRVHAFLLTQYKPTKTWKQNWIEFVRDYADLAAYCGLLPAFFKNPYQDSPEDGYVVSDRMIRYLKKELSFEEILMSMKYANSSINLERYYQFNIEVRPFYSALKILKILKNNGVELVEYSLLAAIVSCLRHEDEIESAVKLILKKYLKGSVANFEGNALEKSFHREAVRFSLSLLSFLKSANLIIFHHSKHRRYVRITKKGEMLLKKTPGRAVFYMHKIEDIVVTPLVGYLLNLFSVSITKGKNILDFRLLYQNIKSVASEKELEDAIIRLSNLKFSPIKKFEKPKIELASIKNQYSVVSVVDFASSHEARFVDEGIGAIPEYVKKVEVVTPPLTMLNSLFETAVSSKGDEYEDVLTEALKSLKFGTVTQYGHKKRAQRYLDIVWQVPIIDSVTNSERMILVLIEAKSGEAIKQLDERTLIDDAKRTIRIYRRKLHKIGGVWIWVLDGKSLPAITAIHGGPRQGAKTFLEKLNELILLTMYVNRPIIVTAMNISCFTEYFSYLYSILRDATKPLNEINTPQFWVWGSLFRPVSSWVFVYDDKEELKRRLFSSHIGAVA